jgi:DHA1 family multidrug resistance protein-like MFS transporter
VTDPLRTPESKTLSALWWAICLVSFPFGILAFVLPIYGRQLGASALEVGAFFSAFSIVPVLVRPFLGQALDRWGRRPFLLAGLVGYLGAVAVFGLASSVWMLTVARFVQGIGSAFLWLTAYTMIADLAAAGGRGLNFGMIDESNNRGMIIGAVLGFTVLFWLQGGKGIAWTRLWWILFAIYGVTTVAALVVAWRGAGETRPLTPPGAPASKGLTRRLLTLMGIVLLTGASGAMVWPMLVIFLQDSLHVQADGLALAYLPAAVISSFLPSRLGVLSDRFGRRMPMIAGLVIGAAASGLIPHLRSLIALTVLWAVESAGYAASVPAERAFVADIAGEDVRGTSYGLYTFAYFLGAVLGPLAGGWLYDRVSPATPFYLNTAALLLGALLVAVALREPARTRQTSGPVA